jgi:hypothetical protein
MQATSTSVPAVFGATADMHREPSVAVAEETGGGRFLLDPVRGWPKCDLCGRVMERDDANSGPGVFAAKCEPCRFTLSFSACRRGHRYCAWDRLHPLEDLP